MVNTKALQEEMRKCGFTLDSLAKEICKSRTCLFNKIHNKNEFKASEIHKISRIFKLKKVDINRIFFAH